MRLKPRFLVSLLVILLLSWANVFYFGTGRTNQLSFTANQVIHVLIMIAIAAIGYYNWKDGKERWVSMLWTTLYTAGFALLGVLLLSYMYYGSAGRHQWQRIIVGVRNVLTGPLPFLVFYLLSVLNWRREGVE